MPSIQDEKIIDRELSSDPVVLSHGSEPRRELSDELVEQALERARAGLGVGELPEELREQLTDAMLDELLRGRRGEAEILGKGGLLGDLTRRLVERCM